jgi:hypothetical protein
MQPPAWQPPAGPAVAPSTDLGPKSFAVGAGLGYAFGGSVGLENVATVDHDGGLVVDAYIDGILVPQFSMGAFITETSMSASGWGSQAATLISVGATLKGRFRLSDRVKLRPGIVFGYNTMSSDAFSESTSGLNIGLHVDVAVATSDTFAIVPRFGFFSQPVGGNKDWTMTFKPHPYLAIMVEFGK